MMKRIISLVLCLGMLAGTLLMAGCGEESTTTSTDESLPMTLSFLGITEDTTTPEAIEATEEALNRIFKTQFKTKVELTFVTADEYIALVDARVAEAKQAETKLAAINKYNALIQKRAVAAASTDSDSDDSLLFGKWAKEDKIIEASTLSTGTAYTAEQTTVYADGKIETVYPTASSPIDILMIADKEMYDYLDEKGYLLSIARSLESEFTKFKQYIYPAFLDQLQTITGDIKAIPNNNVVGEYTYLVVDKAIADKYDFDIDVIETYADLDENGAGFLSEVAASENVTVMATEPEALGIYTYFEGDTAVGTYYNPIYGYNKEEGTDFVIRNLFDIPQYTDHLLLMETYRENGYFDKKSDKFAVNVVKGDASMVEEYSDDYYVKVIQNPFMEMNVVFDGMLAVSEYTSNEKRALQVIQAINTDPEVKNILQYGIEYDGENDEIANYDRIVTENEDGTKSYSIKRRNDTYMMDNALTGNVYMGYPEEGQSIDVWKYYQQTNLDSGLSPFIYFFVGNDDLDGMLDSIIERACLTEAFAPLGINYDDYLRTDGTTQGDDMRTKFKNAYVPFFIECLEGESGITTEPLNFVTKGEGSAVDQDFIEFALSQEGQIILSGIGFSADEDAIPYEKKASMSGTVSLIPNTGNNYLGYIGPLMEQLAAAYTELYPDVEVKLYPRDPANGYNGDLSKVDGKEYTVGIALRDLSTVEESKDLEATNIATSYLSAFNNKNAYPISWYEGKMIEKISAEKYADIASNSDLVAAAANKVAALAGIDIKRYPTKKSESVVLAEARKNAENYYTNLEYLRVMANEVLLDATQFAEFDKYKGADFETAIFNYVRENYEKENNLTEEAYVKLVQDFMASVLVYPSPEDQSKNYSVSWDAFQETKANAQVYIEAATKIKDAYYEQLTATTSAALLKLLPLTEVMDLVYDVMYEEYLAENGLVKAEFETTIKNIYLDAVGSSAEEFATYSKTSDEYKNICASLKKKYKKVLINIFGKTTYEADNGISNDLLLSTLFDHFLEEEIKVNDKMCELAGIDYATFAEAEVHMNNYDKYTNTIKTKFVYTLRTAYTSTQINNWTYEEVEANVYEVLYTTGFYSNELAQYVGLELSDYMLAKNNADAYLNYMKTLVNELSAELQAKGYNTDDLLKENGAVIEEICAEIVLEKYYSDKISILDVVKAASEKYVQGIDSATDLEAYLAEAKEETNKDYFYMAVINSLQSAWVEAKGE